MAGGGASVGGRGAALHPNTGGPASPVGRRGRGWRGGEIIRRGAEKGGGANKE